MQDDPAETPVLLIEDDRQAQQVLRCSLEDGGIPVETAADTSQALDAASRHRPGVIVLDLGISRQESTRIATALRAVCGPNVPIVIISSDEHAPERAQQADAAAYFYKPFPLRGVLNCVRYLLHDRAQ
jgi:two-component system KDP operon response regulator KdpE